MTNNTENTENMDNTWRILLVDDEPNNLQLLRQILKGKYQLSMAKDGMQALHVAKEVNPDLILLDVMMPVLDGYRTCMKLKSDPVTADIPVIFVSAKSDVFDEVEGFGVGAVDYITKPVSGPIVLARVATHLALSDQQKSMNIQVAQRTYELEQSQKAAIHMLGEAGHYNDTDTGMHIWRMAGYSGELGRRFGWSVTQAKQLEFAAPLHDTGKIGIPDAILKKPGKLDANEWEVMKTHAQIGYDILSKNKTELFQLAAEIALNHHERWDGSGYPNGLSGQDIPESARIVAIADVFDALTMKRPYKAAWSIDKAVAEMQRGSGTHFDAQLLDCFLDNLDTILDIKKEWEEKEATAKSYFA